MSVNEIRELTATQLDEVRGGAGVVVVALVWGAAALWGAGMATPGTNFIEEGQKYLQGKGGQL